MMRLTWIVVRGQVTELDFFGDNVLIRSGMLNRPLLVTWSVQNQERQDVDVPHSIDASQKKAEATSTSMCSSHLYCPSETCPTMNAAMVTAAQDKVANMRNLKR